MTRFLPVLALLLPLVLASVACVRRTPEPPLSSPGRAPAGSPTVREPASPDPASEPAPPAPARPAAVSATAPTIGVSVRGRPIRVLDLGSGDDVVLILATIHGDEAAGTPLVERLEVHLRERPALLEGRRVVLVPVANPDGRAAGMRTNERGIDLNRNFPSRNFGGDRRGGAAPLSEPESRAIHALVLRLRPARVVSIHQPLRCLDHDGPAAPLARLMASACDLPVRKLGGRPGSLGSWVGIDLRTPIVTVELPRRADDLSRARLWDRYGAMLLAAVRGR